MRQIALVRIGENKIQIDLFAQYMHGLLESLRCRLAQPFQCNAVVFCDARFAVQIQPGQAQLRLRVTMARP